MDQDGGNGKDKAQEEKSESKILENAKATSATRVNSSKEIYAIRVSTVPTTPDADSSSKEIHAIPVLTVPTKPDAGSSIAGGDPSSARLDPMSSGLSLLKSLRFDYVWNTVFRVRYKIPSIHRVPRRGHYMYVTTLPRRTFVTRTRIYTIPVKLELKISFKIPLTMLLVLAGLSVPAEGPESSSLQPTGTDWKMTMLICLLLGLFLHGASDSIEGSDRIFVRTPCQPGTFVQVTTGVGRYMDVFMRV